MLKANSIINL